MRLSVTRPELAIAELDVRCFDCRRLLFRLRRGDAFQRSGAEIHIKCTSCGKINYVPKEIRAEN